MASNQSSADPMATLIVVVFSIAVQSALIAGVWYAFDDALAELVGVPGLGTIGFWHVYSAAWFVRMVTCRTSVERKP